jgi:hypothetical protein
MRISIFPAFAIAAFATACNNDKAATPAAAPTEVAKAPEAPKPEAKPAQHFGAPLDSATPFVELATILADPKAWDGKKVRTRGEVVAVCQAAGCWADLRPEGKGDVAGPPTHVTMNRHAFFLPKDSKSKVAEIEGQLAVRALSEAEVAHFNAEGASLTAGTPLVNVDALGVALR